MCYSRYTPKLFADLGNKSRADYIVLPSSENVSTPPGEKTDGWTRLAKFKYRIVCGGHSCLFVAWKNAGGCLHLVLLLHQVCCLRLIHNIYIYISCGTSEINGRNAISFGLPPPENHLRYVRRDRPLRREDVAHGECRWLALHSSRR